MDINGIKTRVLPVLKKADVSRSELFGSAARGDWLDGSDYDILVEMKENATLIEFAKLKTALERALSAKVDLVTYDAINDRLKPYIQKDILRIL